MWYGICSKKCDILLCQEILLLEEDLCFINGLSDDFNTIASPSKVAQSNSHDGRPSGSCAVFWRKFISLSISADVIHDHFMLCSVTLGEVSLAIANIYLPCDRRTREGIFYYETALGELQCSIEDLYVNQVILMGDFNADPNRGNIWPYLNEFILNNNFIVNDRDLPGDTLTYLSPAHNTTSWLDHIISSRNCPLHDAFVLYDMSVFDHFPISITLSIPIKSSATSSRHRPLVKEMVDWSNFDSNSAIDYNETVLRCLEGTSVCCDNTCTYDHNDRMDAFYDILIDSIKEGTRNNRFVKTKEFVPVPGWNR